MRGAYKYSSLKLIITKLVGEEQVFLEGFSNCYQYTHIELPSLISGTYILYLKAHWGSSHLMRKLVLNTYAPRSSIQESYIKKVHINEFPPGSYSMMEYWLSDRIAAGEKY
mmetsp:Transcript_18577/g.13495  ORF Transcript_18577/g.13495 Transcript_18577/m.13495 type:complete len:111 (-) Transcript_18577:54-386(-)